MSTRQRGIGVAGFGLDTINYKHCRSFRHRTPSRQSALAEKDGAMRNDAASALLGGYAKAKKITSHELQEANGTALEE
jgi:hypothetical protein